MAIRPEPTVTPLLCVLLSWLVFGACAAPKRSPAKAAASGLPPHAVEVTYGLWSCERGYILRNRQCIPEAEVANEPRFEMFGDEVPIDLEAPPNPADRLTAMPGFDWNESDYPPRPVVSHLFSFEPSNLATVVGEPTPYTLPEGRTMYEAARHLGLGINQVAAAFPDVDLVRPPMGETLDFPTWWVLPDADPRGLVINVPEMRIYYFPSANPQTVITYPVGLGRDDWRTPISRFHVVQKTVDPPWVIPESIQVEHIRERGDARTMIAGGDPENPLGRYRLRLDLPLYGIHGTNIPWGIGMQVTHGCVRLYPEDIEKLFAIVSVGTPGEFVYQPVKIGARGGEIYVEAHPDVYGLGINHLAEALRLIAARGWSSAVEWELLNLALAEKRGVPTRISNGLAPLRRMAPEAVEASGAAGSNAPS